MFLSVKKKGKKTKKEEGKKKERNNVIPRFSECPVNIFFMTSVLYDAEGSSSTLTFEKERGNERLHRVVGYTELLIFYISFHIDRSHSKIVKF